MWSYQRVLKIRTMLHKLGKAAIILCTSATQCYTFLTCVIEIFALLCSVVLFCDPLVVGLHAVIALVQWGPRCHGSLSQSLGIYDLL